MGDRSAIEWTDATWNPVTGCTRVSEGCRNCYIERTPPFRIRNIKFLDRMGMPSHEVGASTGVVLHWDRLDQPLRWTRPRRVFVNSLSDLFHDAVTLDFIAEVFAVMALSPAHTFQVLTKRPARMRAVVDSIRRNVGSKATELIAGGLRGKGRLAGWTPEGDLDDRLWIPPWPLPNVWLGTSVEGQEVADFRIPKLLDTTAAVRFLSCEPLLGPVDLKLEGTEEVLNAGLPQLDWVIVGGESGPGARPMELAWARGLVEQCQAAGVAVFVKQLGERWAMVNDDPPWTSGRRHGGDPDAWPADLAVREYPVAVG